MAKRLALSLSIIVTIFTIGLARAAEVHWSYEGDTGPEFWGNLSEEFALCRDGTSQSPINITQEVERNIGLLNLLYSDIELNIVNNGHTLQVNVPDGVAHIEFGGERYVLKQFHFHTPSEHSESGRYAPMEVHFVHVSAAGKIAVIGAFIKEGRSNSTLGKILRYAPLAEGEIVVPEESVVMTNLLPSDVQEFYHYSGSLTTPPCSEGLNWFVMDDPIHASSSEIEHFRSIFQHNARPVQPLNGRLIIESSD